MKLVTVKFGEIEVSDDLVFDFIEPVLGYEHLSKFTLLDCNQESPFKWLQSVEDMTVSFPVTIPALFGIDYTFVIPQEQTTVIGLEDVEDVLILNIANIPSNSPENATVNLLGPLIINVKNKKAIQMILNEGNYGVRHKLFPDSVSESEKV